MAKHASIQFTYKKEPEKELVEWFKDYAKKCNISRSDLFILLVEKERNKADPQDAEFVGRIL